MAAQTEVKLAVYRVAAEIYAAKSISPKAAAQTALNIWTAVENLDLGEPEEYPMERVEIDRRP